MGAFFFPKKSSFWITILRTGLGLQVIGYSFSIWKDWSYLFVSSDDGMISREIAEAVINLQSPLIPNLGWFVLMGRQVGLTEGLSLHLIVVLLLASGLFLLLGLFSRPAALSAWLFHLSARSSGEFLSYGVDNFMTIGLFYLMICPLPDCYALDHYLWKSKPASERVGFHQRVLQLHLSLIYFFGGLAKALGAGWWNGTSIWRALTRPPSNIISPQLLLSFSSFLPALGISIVLLELGYIILIWPKRIRPVVLACAIGMHAGIALAMGMFLFAFVMIVLNLAAFGDTYLAPTLRLAQAGRLRLLQSLRSRRSGQ